MRKSIVLCMIISFMWAIAAGAAEHTTPQVGESLPEMALPIPGNQGDRAYLGLKSAGETFSVKELAGKIVIMQIYSMYCPHCQADAPHMNRFYRLIESTPAFRDRIKIIGIAAGNTPFEVKTYKKKYAVPFPLIPDTDFTIHNILGGVRTPYFIAVTVTADGRTRVIYSRLGALEDRDQFPARLLELSLQGGGDN